MGTFTYVKGKKKYIEGSNNKEKPKKVIKAEDSEKTKDAKNLKEDSVK